LAQWRLAFAKMLVGCIIQWRAGKVLGIQLVRVRVPVAGNNEINQLGFGVRHKAFVISGAGGRRVGAVVTGERLVGYGIH